MRLDVESSALIDSHREALRSVLAALRDVPEASAPDLHLLEAEIERLGDGFFMLLVAGEFNGGKSSLINALLGKDVLAVGATPTTSAVTVLRYAHKREDPVVGKDGIVVVGEPTEVLASRLQIVDTPGTNAIERQHEMLTRQFLPLCDIVLFVTSADRPFSESERVFLESIRKWGKKVVLIVNKMDLLEQNVKAEVLDFVTEAAKSMLDAEPKVFALSSRHARMAKDDEDVTSQKLTWDASGFGPLEDYIDDSLDSLERLRLKLKASASLGTTLADKYLAILERNKVIVEADNKAIRKIQSLLKRHEQSVRTAYPSHFARVENVLLGIHDRADTFFDTHIKMSNLWHLSNKSSMEHEFEDNVLTGTTKAVQRQIQNLGDWLSEASSRNLAETMAVLSHRAGERGREIENMRQNQSLDVENSSLHFSDFPSGRDLDVMSGREGFVSRLSEVSEEVSSEYISRREGKRIADKITHSLRFGAGIGIGAVGSIALYVAGLGSVDPILFYIDTALPALATVLGAAGLVTVPRQRMALRSDLRRRVEKTKVRMERELRNRVEEHLTTHISGLQDAVRPFAEFANIKEREINHRKEKVMCSLASVRRLQDKLNDIDSAEVVDEQEKR